MKPAKVISITENDHFADYAELAPWHDQERFAMTTDPVRPLLLLLVRWMLAAAVGMGIWWALIWAAVGGWRVVHAFIERVTGAIR